jgi:hypothetical protein
MKKIKEIGLEFEIDKLTNSIENSISGETFNTLIIKIKETKRLNKTDWTFDWHLEIKDNSKLVWGLTTQDNQSIFQGLISITDKDDHVFMNLIENAKFNKGKNKLYTGVAGNLVAFACKLSFEKGYDGIVSFVAKTQLIEHYSQTLGAKLFGRNRMYIDTKEAQFLATKYFKK